jgi:hypothetical protein
MFKKLCLLLLFGYSANAQLFDSTNVGVIAGAENNYYDTTLTIKAYHSFNDYGIDEFGIISMGNQGDVRRRLVWNKPFELNPHLGIDGYFKNYRKSDQVPFYNVKAPSGGIRVLTGYTKGQMFGLYFTVNPIARLNVFLDFQRINARGRYFNQENTSDQLKFSTSYYTKNNAYRIATALSWNRASNFEFGGIADTTPFQENNPTNRELIDVRLQNSDSKIRYTDFMINQDYRLLKIASADLRIGYDFSLLNQTMRFNSSDSVFTQNAIFQSQSITDSVAFSRYTNHVKLSLSNQQHTLDFGIVHMYHQYGNVYFQQAENNLGLRIKYRGKFDQFSSMGKFEYLTSNNYSSTYQLDLAANYDFANRSSIRFALNNRLVTPGLFYQRFMTNNFFWDNGFNKVGVLDVNLEYQWRQLLRIKAGSQWIGNYIYLNEFAIPEQTGENIAINFVELAGTLPLGASFYLDNRIRYQQTNTASVIRIPNWLLRQVFYFERDIFNRAARLQTGIEFLYFSSFTSEAYMPATTSMYLQNDIQTGNFPYFNFFLNFRIQEFTFYLRLENVTQGLFAFDYYAAPFFPLPDFAFRIGATWRFFN